MMDANKRNKANNSKHHVSKYYYKIAIPTIILVIALIGVFCFKALPSILGIANSTPKLIYIPLDENSRIYVYNDPNIVSKIPVNLTVHLNYTVFAAYRKVYFLVDPDLKGNFSLGIVQLEAEVLYPAEKYTGVKIVEGCLESHPLCIKRKLFIGNCSLIKGGLCIEYKEGPLGIYQISPNHIVISGNQSNILLATDYFVLMYYGLV